MIDCHTHIFLQGEVPEEGGYDAQLLKHGLAFRAARAAVSARRALEQGFTTIRDVETEGAGYGDVGIKQAIEAGYIPGPRMFVVTRAISTSGGYPLEGYAPEVTVPKGVQIVDGPVEAHKGRAAADRGADWLKIYVTRSWVDKEAISPRSRLSRWKRSAHRGRGARVGKSPRVNGVGRRGLDGGRDSTSMASSLTTPPSRRWSGSTWLVPPMSPYDHCARRARRARDRQRVAVHGPSLQGRRPGSRSRSADSRGAIRSRGSSPVGRVRHDADGGDPVGTARAAEMLHGGEMVVAPGAYADIVAVTGDPLADVKVLESVAFAKDGKVYRSEIR
jgi:hypothetical protein